ncbi:MAG: heme A synthase [Gemmatimonadetes bacterium]|nr:heme A synthase [Gemmatimonadota bacterium]
MKTLRTLAFATAAFAYALIVLGAVVRITDSGLGCGDHWPLCNGQVIPSFADYHVAIEFAHRIAALGLFVLIVSLAATALARRSLPGVPGPGGVLRPALLALGLYFSLAVIGAIVVKVDLHSLAVVLHLGTAMTLLATLLIAGWRAQEGLRSLVLGIGNHPIPKTQDPRPADSGHLERSAIAALVLAAGALLLGGLTATTGASTACQGFPLCNGRFWPEAGTGGLAHLQWMHRLVGYVLFGHLIGMAMRAWRRGASATVRVWVGTAVACAVGQVTVAAVMVLRHLPAEWRAVHAAVGTALWVAVVGLARQALARAKPATG